MRFIDSNDIEKDWYINPLFIIRSNKKEIFPYEELDNELLSNAYVARKIGQNRSQVHVEEDLNENDRKIHTPQINPESLFQFPFNAKREDLETRSKMRLGKRKKSSNAFGSSGNMNEFKLQINRVVIRQKVIQKRKLPMIIQRKEIKPSTKEEHREDNKPNLPPDLKTKPSFNTKEEVKKVNVEKAKNLKSTIGKPKPAWGAPVRKNKVTSNELRFQYDKNYRLALQENMMVNASMNIESNKSKSIISTDSIQQSKDDQTLSNDDNIPTPKAKKTTKGVTVKPVKAYEEPVIINPRPRPIFATPDFYLVRYTC